MAKKAKKQKETALSRMEASPMDDSAIIKYVLSCRTEAEFARKNRDRLTSENMRMFNLDYDFSHKIEGQSKEMLGRVSMAVEKTALFFQQTLVDVGDWWSVEAERGESQELNMTVKPSEIYKLTEYHLTELDHYSVVGKEIKAGLLSGTVITKIMGWEKYKPKFVEEKDETAGSTKVIRGGETSWRLMHKIVQSRNYYPDPKAGDHEKLKYEVEDMWSDLSAVKKLAVGPNKIYRKELVDLLKPSPSTEENADNKKQEQTGQPDDPSAFRSRTKLTEFWGDIEDNHGNIIYENCHCVIANDTQLIRRPVANPMWDQESPYVVTSLFEGLDTRWPKALMDVPSMHNKSLIELYNLIVDGAAAAAQNLKVLRQEWLANGKDFENGIPNGATLLVNGEAPPQAKILEAIQSGNVPQEALAVFNLMNQEYNSAAVDSDLRSGATPFRRVKATEVVEQSNAITSILTGVSKNYEEKHLMRKLRKSWSLMAQRMNDSESQEMEDLLGTETAGRLSGLTPQQRFAGTVNGAKFKASGISRTLARQSDFQAYATLLQIISGSEVLAEAFVQKYGFDKLIGEVIETLGIKRERIKITPEQEQLNQDPNAASVKPGQSQPGTQPNNVSQQPKPQDASTSIASLLGTQNQAFTGAQ